MTAIKGGKQRWVVQDGIPGIAAEGEIVIVRPGWGILVTRWLHRPPFDSSRVNLAASSRGF